jgi:hypothetical protein
VLLVRHAEQRSACAPADACASHFYRCDRARLHAFDGIDVGDRIVWRLDGINLAGMR